MKNAKKLFSLLIVFALLMSFVPTVTAQEVQAQDETIYSAVVRFEEGADGDALCKALENMPGIRVRWQYSALFSGAAIEGTRRDLALAGENPGVASLSLCRKWTQSDIVVDPIEPTNSLDVMNGLEIPYDGDGMVIAVLDSGLKLSHETFADHGIMDEETITKEIVENFTANGGTNGRYISRKIPFAYDYSGRDRSVHTMDNHGTHVSALAVGYALREDGSVQFRGAAPAAQLLSMKVFPDDADLGADDADILKAMEDAWLLGADVINLSLGMPNAFEEDRYIGAVYGEVLAKLEASGVIVCCAVGNEDTALSGKPGDTALPTADYTDYSDAAAPAIYDGAIAIAAVNSAFYEAGGGMIVGEKTIVLTEAVAEAEGWEPPSVDALAGQTMDYVVIAGLGTAEDFAGLDLTGCAALVSRGEIYFSEKARNAAAAGAALCIIYNNEPGAILPAVDDISIPCVMITQEEGKYLMEQAQNGRGTLTIAPDRMLIPTGEGLSMFSYSSWGASPSLGLSPALSAPGGMILSAGMETNGAYGYLSGTSMAAPNASGAYALVLQALRERGIEDKAERARLATALLAGTARIMTDGEGTPLSPRRQGAGVIDLAAALACGAVIEDPLLEPGENALGQFALRFTVKNLTNEEKTYFIDTTVLTDAYVHTENALRSSLSPLDISDRVTITGVKRVRLQPGESREVTLTLTVDPDVRKELTKVFANGFYVEGYVTLSEQSGESVHATFLGYCGDWEQAPIIEQVDFRAVMNAYYEQQADVDATLSALPVNMGFNYALLCDARLDTYGALLLGENPFALTPAHDSRIAMSTVLSDAIAYRGDRFVVDLYTLRNAEHVIMIVSDQKTGEIYCVDDRAYLPRSLIPENVGMAASGARFIWDGTDRAGQVLPGGTAVRVDFYAWLETEDAVSDAYRKNETKALAGDYRWLIEGDFGSYIEWSFPLVLDGSAPQVRCCVQDWLQQAEITVTDDRFLAYFAVQDENGSYLVRKVYAGEQPGEQYTVSVPLAGYEETMLYITATDYAGNMVGYEVDLTGETAAVRCAAAMLTDVEKNAWYHDAVDYVIEEGLMTIGDGLTFSPDAGALRAQVLEMLYDLAGRPVLPQDSVTLPFGDVATGASYRAALEWAYSKGIVNGYGEGVFGAYAPVQRAQLAVMLCRAAQAAGETIEVGDHTFADGDETPEWAMDALCWAVEMEYLTLDEEGNINAGAYVTRAEFAYLLMNLYKNN